MKTLKECVEIAYKSMAIIYGSTRNKWNIVLDNKEYARSKQMSYEIGSEEYIKWENIKIRWSDLSTRLSWGWHFYKGGYAGAGNGVHLLLQELYDLLGYSSKDDLNYFDDYDNLQIYQPISFIEEPSQNVIDLENSFENDDDIFRTTIQDKEDFESLYKIIFNATVKDIYTGIGMGMWLDNQLDRDSATGDDPELAIAMWDMILEGSRNFLYTGRNCLADVEIESKTYFDTNILRDRKFEHTVRTKYVKNNEDSMLAVGGVFKINYDKLPEEWKNKVNMPPVSYE